MRLIRCSEFPSFVCYWWIVKVSKQNKITSFNNCLPGVSTEEIEPEVVEKSGKNVTRRSWSDKLPAITGGHKVPRTLEVTRGDWVLLWLEKGHSSRNRSTVWMRVRYMLKIISLGVEILLCPKFETCGRPTGDFDRPLPSCCFQRWIHSYSFDIVESHSQPTIMVLRRRYLPGGSGRASPRCCATAVTTTTPSYPLILPTECSMFIYGSRSMKKTWRKQ